MKQNSALRNNLSLWLLFVAFVFGAWFRISPAWTAAFPINDGGMFHVMLLDLQTNQYALPAFTTYNHAQIPFAYPPLGFYLGAFLSDLFNISPLIILRWLPGILNALCIPAFYFLAKELLQDEFQSAAATCMYALTPHLTSWYSMGGGLTRSLGMFFALLMLTHAHRLFTTGAKKSLWLTMLFGALTVLSHTEAPLYAAALAVYFWLVKARNWQSLLKGGAVACGVLVLTAPWYATIIARHGLAPFVSIAQTGAHTPLAIFKIINIAFLTEERYLGILGALGILGVAALVAKRAYFIPLMLPVIFWIQPRSAHLMGNIPLALAGGFFVGLLFSATPQRFRAAFFSILAAYLFFNSTGYALQLATWTVTPLEREALTWVSRNTPADSVFVALTGNPDPFCDSVNEWFPALTGRRNLTTLQGLEWTLGESFESHTLSLAGMQGCGDAACVNAAASFDYLYVSLAPPRQDCGMTKPPAGRMQALADALAESESYTVAFRSDAAVVFEKR